MHIPERAAVFLVYATMAISRAWVFTMLQLASALLKKLMCAGCHPVRLVSMPGKQHQMISNATEVRHLMEFWAQSLNLTPVSSKATGDLYEVSAGMTPETLEQLRCMGPC